MAETIPIKGVLYNPAELDISSALSPPYDIISPEFKETLYKRNPHNIVRVDFGKEMDGDSDEVNRYSRAAEFISEWTEKGIFLNDSEPAFYCYEITYDLGGEIRKTRGFLGAVKIEELGKGSVHPHEKTYSKPKSDRLDILRYCQANTSPIFSLYSSEEKIASSVLENIVKENPFIEATCDDGFKHRLWRIRDIASIKAIQKDLADKDVFIADGHHRYETSLTYKKEMEAKGLSKTGNEPFNYVLMFLSNMEDEGLTLLPTHRIVKVDHSINIPERLQKSFELRKIDTGGPGTRDEVIKIVESTPHCFGMFLTGSEAYYTLSFKGSLDGADMPGCLKKLDVTILHKVIFEELLNIEDYEYEKDPGVAVDRAIKGSFEAVFYLKATSIHDVKDVAMAGHRMPPKSTYFFPKLMTGMVIYKF